MRNKKGFTLVEILVSIMLMAIVIGAMFQMINHLFELNEINEVMVIGTNVAQGMIDEIRNVDAEDIIANYNNHTFSLDELTNKNIPHIGLVTIEELEAGLLLRIKVVICWQQKNRIIGEDANLNGILDADEDENGNGEIDSPCMLDTAIFIS